MLLIAIVLHPPQDLRSIVPIADLPPIIAMFIDAVNNVDVAAMESIFAHDLMVFGDNLRNKQLVGLDAFVDHLKRLRVALPDVKVFFPLPVLSICISMRMHAQDIDHFSSKRYVPIWSSSRSPRELCLTTCTWKQSSLRTSGPLCFLSLPPSSLPLPLLETL